MCLVLSLLLLAQAAPAKTYAVLYPGRVAGRMSIAAPAPDTLRFEFESSDRGNVQNRAYDYRLDPGGLPTSLKVANRNPRFPDGSEEGFAAKAGQKGFYLSASPYPGEDWLVARALLRAPGRSMPLLPYGRASLRRAGGLTLEGHGERRRVSLVLVDGLTYGPVPVWLNPDGSLFADTTMWHGAVEDGWAAEWPRLMAAQEARTLKEEAGWQRRLAHRYRRLAFAHVRLFDAENAAVREDQTVVLDGDRVSAVGPAAETKVPRGARVVDGRGKTLLPGLWDMHVHLDNEETTEGRVHLLYGVTTVRDLGNRPEWEVRLRDAIARGEIAGPRMVLAGMIDGKTDRRAPSGVFAATPEEATAAVDRYHAMGFEGVKMYGSTPPALVPIVAARAHALGMRVGGHVPYGMTATQCVEAGYDEIQHLRFFDDDPELFKLQGDVRGGPPFLALSRLTPDTPYLRRRIELFRERGAALDPTFAGTEAHRYEAREGRPAPGFEDVLRNWPARSRRDLEEAWIDQPDERLRAIVTAERSILKALDDAGVRLVLGTDFFPGVTLEREMEEYVLAGIPAPKVLQMATLGAARVLRKDGQWGCLKPGMLADAALVSGDPTRAVGDVRRVEMTVKGGAYYLPKELRASLGFGTAPSP